MGCYTVRAARWSPPGGRASAIVRVSSPEDRYLSMDIGVFTDRHTRWWCRHMSGSPWAWAYHTGGAVWHEHSILKRKMPKLVSGQAVKVTLDALRVAFLLKDKVDGAWVEKFAFDLPEQCGNITLGVRFHSGCKVTLLP